MAVAGNDAALRRAKSPLARLTTAALGFVGVLLVLITIALAAGVLDRIFPELASQRATDAYRLLAGVATLGFLAAVLYARERDRFLAALWAVTPRLPAMIAIAWLVLYLPLGQGPTETLGVGLWLALVGWLIATVPLVGWASDGNRRTREYGELAARLDQLTCRHAEIVSLYPGSAASRGPVDEARAIGLKEAGRQLALVTRMLADPDGTLDVKPEARGASPFEWVSGAAYTNGRRALHHAEEALIDAEPISAVIGDALHDSLRMTRSTIENDDAIRDALRAAVRELDPRLENLYFNTLRGRADDAPPRSNQPINPEDDAAARAVIREVRYAINDFRDGRIEALFRARNRVFRTILVTGIVTDLLLGLAILMHVDPGPLAAAAAFFLVGAVVGMFNRLRLEVGPDRGTEADFGLFDARILQTLLLSGVAAVGGVFLAALAPLASSQVDQAAAALDLSRVFSIETNPLGFLVAAAFGLTPDAIIGRLREQTDALKKDLSSSEPAVGPQAVRT